jgi:hypothetical protein
MHGVLAPVAGFRSENPVPGCFLWTELSREYYLEDSISVLYGQLATLDKSGKVHMVHETAREFPLQPYLDSEFGIQEAAVHSRLAKACLAYLLGDEMKSPRTGRRVAKSSLATRSIFYKYACPEFSYHLARSDPADIEVLASLDKFLSSNILSWIECVAGSGNLSPLIQTAEHFKSYLVASASERPHLNEGVQPIRTWSIDLMRIAAKFSSALIAMPASISSFIHPFCPSEPAISKLNTQIRRLSVLGYSSSRWDDRLSFVEYHGGQATAICYGADLLSVGLSNGNIVLYDTIPCQEHLILNHDEQVRFLQFQWKTAVLASCGMTNIRVRDVKTGELRHTAASPYRPLDIAFDGNTLLVASYKTFLYGGTLESLNLALQIGHGFGWMIPEAR